MNNTIHSSSILIIAKSEIETLGNKTQLIKVFTVKEFIEAVIMIIYILILMQAYADLRLDEVLSIEQNPQLLIGN